MKSIFDYIREGDLNPTEAIVFQYYILNSPFAEPNNAVADELNVSLSVISRAKRKLLKLGLITVEKNYTSGLARDADTITSNYAITDIIGVKSDKQQVEMTVVSTERKESSKKEQTVVLEENEVVRELDVTLPLEERLLLRMTEIVESNLRKSARAVSFGGIVAQMTNIDTRLKPKFLESHKAKIVAAIQDKGYNWSYNTVFATLM
ncbi:Rrf2 family transcriptional regulator [Flammeovirga kamogawensis]|uniref:MarR family transcriptional regulator n=1 Tax=Flammeovirga kamogawensis TaxID=373891 RepID=A0ABX8GXL8_9BACT|nr:Rrf2 family transcriptional regulator [Flammeovirga kamogawensis]MBB6460718.1 DNA-binding Lrp family transcriptional regulator [Flammeovirga kamogawensis]QWG08072.1 hypothetical protein KM029_03805 [Flammeovirga kamogawensis]TRX69877.1 Rrf2 family transcriptional regulator [Flammeovirga kamogawensis]